MHKEDSAGGGMTNGADGEGLIDPDLFILTSTNHEPDEVYDAAYALRRMGQRVETRTEALKDRWAGLAAPGIYQTPQRDAVLALMDPAVDAAADFKSGSETAYSAVLIFGYELALVQSDLADLEERAREFRDSVIDGVEDDSLLPALTKGLVGGGTVHWTENGDAVEKNKALLKEYAGILVKVSEAAVDAAKKIRAIDGMPYAPEPEPWDVDTLMSTQAPWGTPVEENLDPLEQVGHGVWNTLSTTAEGLWNLTPFSGGLENPWDKLKRVSGNWRDLGLGLLGTAGYLGLTKYKNGGIRGAEDIIERLENSDDPFSQWLAEQLKRGETTVMPLAGGGMSQNMDDAIDRWQNQPWQVGTESALAWLMMLIPGPKGVTKGFPMKPGKAAMVQAMADAAGLYQTGAGWYIRGGIKVADVTGNWLSHKVNPSQVPDYPHPGKHRRH